MSQTNPTPAPAAPDHDLSALEQRQAALFRALSEYQANYPDTDLCNGCLALFYRIEVLSSGTHYVEAVLGHEGGGHITSGLVPVDPFGYDLLQERCRLASDMVLGICASPAQSQPQQPQKPCPLPLQQEAPVESAGPERRTDSPAKDTPIEAAAPEAQAPDPEPAPAAPAAPPAPAADAAPDADEVEELLAQLDVIVNSGEEGQNSVKLLVQMFKDQFRVRGAFARAITTRERADWLRERIQGLKK